MVAAAARQPQSVLFLCSMNAVRSPMACALFQFLTNNTIAAASAGVRPGFADPFVAAVMDEIGIDLFGFEPQGIDALAGRQFELIISLSPEAQHHAVEMTRTMAAEVQYWPTMDVGQLQDLERAVRLTHYRQLRDMLLQRIKQEFELTGAPRV